MCWTEVQRRLEGEKAKPEKRKAARGALPPVRGQSVARVHIDGSACAQWLRQCPWSWLRPGMGSVPPGSEGPMHLAFAGRGGASGKDNNWLAPTWQ